MDTKVKGWKSVSLHTTQPKQMYYDEWTQQVETVTYAGRCVLCGYTTYLKTNGNDPRGFTGLHHTADPLEARDYDMVGPDVPACYDCHSNNGESYRKLLDIAKTNYWRAQA